MAFKVNINFMLANKEDGFTLVELLIVIAVTLALAATAMPLYGRLQSARQLDAEMTLIIQNLRLARGRSVAGINNSVHGVEFASNRYILYQGSSYAARDEDFDQVFVLDSSLTISSNLASNEVDFSKGIGLPDNTGSITISHGVTGSRVISVNSLGKVEKD